MRLYALLTLLVTSLTSPPLVGLAEAGPLQPSALLNRPNLQANTPRSPLFTPAIAESGDDRTGAPYFQVAGQSGVESLPLKETSASAEISGVIARVRVKQVFENTGNTPIEAIYVFPASTRAAVHGMRMSIGERTIEAKIEKRAVARAEYDAAKQAGQRASLLEQQRPNVFTMNVANIMPKDRIETELEYSELLVPQNAVYEFVYPTVVGPRFPGGVHPQRDGWIANPYLQEGAPPPYRFDFQLGLQTGIPIKELSSPSHPVDVQYTSGQSARVRVTDPASGNRDVVIRYRLAGDSIETGVLLSKGKEESFFALMMEPPRTPRPEQIPPREYIFLLDVSGSMHGFPLETAKELMGNLLTQLRPKDRFNVVLFAGASYVMNPEGSLSASPDHIQSALELIGRQRGGGGTQLLEGLRASYAIPQPDDHTSRSVVVVTDGYVGVEAETFQFIRDHQSDGNLFSFGIGSSVNRHLIEGMARAGYGEPFVVIRPQEAKAQAEKLRHYIEAPALTDIRVRFHGLDAYEVAPQKVPDLLAQRPIVVFGKFRGEATGSIEVSGFSGDGRYHKTIDLGAHAADGQSSALQWLWARKWVEWLEDQYAIAPAKELEEGITDLGLSYHLLTPFTSFVAVDGQVVNRGGNSQTVNQPLPLPQGVSNLAVSSGKAVGGQTGGIGAPGGVPQGGVPQREATLGIAASKKTPMALHEAPPPTQRSKARMQFEMSASDQGASTPFAPAPSPAVERPAPVNPRVTVSDVRAGNAGDVSQLIQAIKARLESSTGCARTGPLKLRLLIDANQRIVGLELLRPQDAAIAQCLRTALAALMVGSSGNTPTKSIELTVEFH